MLLQCCQQGLSVKNLSVSPNSVVTHIEISQVWFQPGYSYRCGETSECKVAAWMLSGISAWHQRTDFCFLSHKYALIFWDKTSACRHYHTPFMFRAWYSQRFIWFPNLSFHSRNYLLVSEPWRLRTFRSRNPDWFDSICIYQSLARKNPLRLKEVAFSHFQKSICHHLSSVIMFLHTENAIRWCPSLLC